MHTMNSWGRFPTIHMSQRSLQLDTSPVSEVLLLLEPADFLANITSLLLPERRRGGAGCRLWETASKACSVAQLTSSNAVVFSVPHPHITSCSSSTEHLVLNCGGGEGENTVANSNTSEKDVMLHRLWKFGGGNIFCRTSLLPGRENQKQHLLIFLWGHGCCLAEN